MRSSACIVTAALVMLSRAAFAEDDATLACIDSNADAQKLERAGQLRDAAAKLVSCANAACPAAVRSDCAVILARVEAAEPSIVVEVRDENGNGTTRGRVWIDDALAPEAGAGRAVLVDPGAHAVRVELGASRRETRAVVVQGEKAKRVVLDFTAPKPLTTTSSRFVVPWLSWTLAGVSVLSAGAFAYFGVSGDSVKSHLDATCRGARTCNPSDYSDMATRYTAADVFIAVAAGSLALAVITAIAWPREKRVNLHGGNLHVAF